MDRVPWSWSVLATKGASQQSTFSGDFAKGAAIGAVAALAALFAVSKCSGKEVEAGYFQRA